MKLNNRDPETWVPKEMYAAFCGAGSEKDLTFYDKAVGKKNPISMQFDWLAFFFFPAWMGYRRQWVMWWTILALLGGISFFEVYFSFSIPSSAFAGTFIAMGMLANGFLLMSANGHYYKLLKQGDVPDIAAALKGSAERSVPLAFVGFFGQVGLLILIGYVAEMIRDRL